MSLFGVPTSPRLRASRVRNFPMDSGGQHPTWRGARRGRTGLSVYELPPGKAQSMISAGQVGSQRASM
jgi:hypothetical protein